RLDEDLQDCCFSLDDRISELQRTENEILNTVEAIEDDLNDCCDTIISQLEDLTNITEDCCEIINDKIGRLTLLVEADSIKTFSTLTNIINNELTIESKLDACCIGLNSKLDNLDDDLLDCCSSIHDTLNAIQHTENEILRNVLSLDED